MELICTYYKGLLNEANDKRYEEVHSILEEGQAAWDQKKKEIISDKTLTGKSRAAAMVAMNKKYSPKESVYCKRVDELQKQPLCPEIEKLMSEAEGWTHGHYYAVHRYEPPVLCDERNYFRCRQLCKDNMLPRPLASYPLQKIKDELTYDLESLPKGSLITELLNSAGSLDALFVCVIRLFTSTYVSEDILGTVSGTPRLPLWYNVLFHGFARGGLLPVPDGSKELISITRMPGKFREALLGGMKPGLLVFFPHMVRATTRTDPRVRCSGETTRVVFRYRLLPRWVQEQIGIVSACRVEGVSFYPAEEEVFFHPLMRFRVSSIKETEPGRTVEICLSETLDKKSALRLTGVAEKAKRKVLLIVDTTWDHERNKPYLAAIQASENAMVLVAKDVAAAAELVRENAEAVKLYVWVDWYDFKKFTELAEGTKGISAMFVSDAKEGMKETVEMAKKSFDLEEKEVIGCVNVQEMKEAFHNAVQANKKKYPGYLEG